MTREEQLRKLVDEEMGVENYGSIDYQVGFGDGVRVVDENPKEGLVSIAKACRWLRENIDLYAMDTVNAGTMRHKIVLMSNFEEGFIKAMED